MAFAALGTLLAGGAATMSVGAIIAGVGTGLSIVGAVTGNQGMMKLGGVMGLVGGVAGMFASTAAGEVAGSAIAESATESAGSAVFNAAKDSQLANVAIEAGGGDALAGYAADSAVNWGAAAQEASSALGFEPTNAAVIDPAATFDKATTPGSAVQDQIKPLINEAPTTSEALKQASLTNPNGTRINNPSAYTSDNSSFNAAPTKNYFQDFLGWVKNNEKTAEGIMKIGGTALSGMAEQSRFDEKMAFEKSRGQYGNVVADVYGQQPRRSLIGARA